MSAGEAHVRRLAPGQHRSEETPQRWRAVGDTVPDSTGHGIEFRPPAPIAISLTTRLRQPVEIMTFKNIRLKKKRDKSEMQKVCIS